MTALAWPSNELRPSTQSLYLQSEDVRVWNKPASGAEQVASTMVQRWRCRMQFDLAHDMAQKMDNLLARLRGPVGTVIVPVFREFQVTRTGSISAASAGAYTLNVTGGTPFQMWPAGWLLSPASGRLHRVVEDAGTDGTGVATLKIEPALRSNITLVPISQWVPKVEMRLMTKDAGKNETRRGFITTYTLELIEAWS